MNQSPAERNPARRADSYKCYPAKAGLHEDRVNDFTFCPFHPCSSCNRFNHLTFLNPLYSTMFDHPIILIIVVVAALLRWLSQKSDAGKPDPERPTVPDQPIPRGGETQTEEERIRRFLEALGQPATSTPPPKVTRRSTAPKREVLPHVPPFKSPLPPLTTVPPPLVTTPPPLPTFPTSTSQVPLPPPIERVFKPAIA